MLDRRNVRIICLPKVPLVAPLRPLVALEAEQRQLVWTAVQEVLRIASSESSAEAVEALELTRAEAEAAYCSRRRRDRLIRSSSLRRVPP